MRYNDISKHWHVTWLMLCLLFVLLCFFVGIFGFVKLALSLVVSLCVVVIIVWCFRVNVFRFGFKKAVRFSRLKKRLVKQLIGAGICLPAAIEGYVRGPRVSLDFDHGDPIISIEDRVEWHKAMENVNLGSALGRYSVDDRSYDNVRNVWQFVLHDYSTSRRFIFRDLVDLREAILENNRLVIDQELCIKPQHMLITGRTGSGKSYFTEFLLLQFWLRGADLFVCDPKNADMAVLGEALGAKVAVSANQIAGCIRSFYELMMERQKKVRSALGSKMNRTAYDLGMHNCYLVLDEFSAMQGLIGQLKDKDKVRHELQSIIYMGRQSGCYVVFITQKTDATVIPTSIRDQLGFRLVLGQNDSTTYQTAFGQSANVPDLPLNSEGSGFYVLDGGNLVPRFVQTPRLDFDILRAVRDTHMEGEC